MKTLANKKEISGNLEGILHVKPKNRNNLSGSAIYWKEYP